MDGSHNKGSTWWGFLDMHVPTFCSLYCNSFPNNSTVLKVWSCQIIMYIPVMKDRYCCTGANAGSVECCVQTPPICSNTPYHPENASLPHLVSIALWGGSGSTFSAQIDCMPSQCFSFAFNTCFLPHVKISMHTLCILSKVRLDQLLQH